MRIEEMQSFWCQLKFLYLVSIRICHPPSRLVLLFVTDISPSQPIFLHVVLIMEQRHNMPVSLSQVTAYTDMCPVLPVEGQDNSLSILEEDFSQ